MRRRRFVRSGDLRVIAAVAATVAFAILLNRPGSSSNTPTWTDAPVLRLNLPSDVVVPSEEDASDYAAAALPQRLPSTSPIDAPAARIARSDSFLPPPHSPVAWPKFRIP